MVLKYCELCQDIRIQLFQIFKNLAIVPTGLFVFYTNNLFKNFKKIIYLFFRNYFCQPYIGFVPETKEYRNVRKEMVKQSARVAKRLSQSIRYETLNI